MPSTIKLILAESPYYEGSKDFDWSESMTGPGQASSEKMTAREMASRLRNLASQIEVGISPPPPPPTPIPEPSQEEIDLYKRHVPDEKNANNIKWELHRHKQLIRVATRIGLMSDQDKRIHLQAVHIDMPRSYVTELVR